MPIPTPAATPRMVRGTGCEVQGADLGQVGGRQGGGDEHQEHGDDLVEGRRAHLGGPVRPIQAPIRLPANRFTTTYQYGVELAERDRDQPSGESGDHHDQAHRLVQDHRLQGEEPEHPDQQRQSELGSAQADHPAEDPDASAGHEGPRQRSPNHPGSHRRGVTPGKRHHAGHPMAEPRRPPASPGLTRYCSAAPPGSDPPTTTTGFGGPARR